jgi:hypothetical protein
MLALVAASTVSGFVATPSPRPLAPQRRGVAASPLMVDAAAANELVAAAGDALTVGGVAWPHGEPAWLAPEGAEEFNLLGRMATHFMYVSVGIAGAYVTQGAEGVEVDADGERRSPWDRTLPPPKDYGDDDPWDDFA